MRLVLDTNVIASAMLWGGSPKLLLLARREKRVELYTSTPLISGIDRHPESQQVREKDRGVFTDG
jgi:predicted nucleic acid-binding protein